MRRPRVITQQQHEAGDIIMMCKELDGDAFYARELVVAAARAYVKSQRLPILGDSRR